MKNRTDCETALKNELIHWFPIQTREIESDFYLYFLPSTASHSGGLIICRERPANPDYQLAMPEKIEKHSSVEQNFNRIRSSVLGRLPICDWQ